MVKIVTAKQARQNFSEILNEVYFGNKKIMVTKSGKPMVLLISAKDAQKKGQDNI